MLPLSSSITTPTLSDVESSLKELNNAIIGHTRWLTEWNTRIICGIPVEEKYTSEESHKESFFGRWYYAEHADFIKLNPEFCAIEEQHRMVHSEMRSLVKMINRGEAVTRAEYESFIKSEASLSESVINIRDDLFKLLLSFDYLTGALNRQAFFHILDQEYSRVTRFGEPGCIVLLDIDNFKNINDKFGHAAGDKVLIAITRFIIENMRPYDSVCRYGGEEFLMCMPKTTVEMAHNIVERIREKLSQQEVAVTEKESINVSASFGLTAMSAQEKLKQTIEHADKALYKAKKGGRNKVVVWNSGGFTC